MWEALRVAQAEDFVRNMPGGLEAHIEQGGTNVSGGQRQRLSIARALVRRPDIYVFDDSFSALDLATDARLREALVPYTRQAAVVIVAQRVSTISTADQIIVLDDGVVVGRGTHDELLERVRHLRARSSSPRSAKGGRPDVERRGAERGAPGDPRRDPPSPGRLAPGRRAHGAVGGLRGRDPPARSAAAAGLAPPRPDRGDGAGQHRAQRARPPGARPGHRRGDRRPAIGRGDRLPRAAPRPLRGHRALHRCRGARGGDRPHPRRRRAAAHVRPPPAGGGEGELAAAPLHRPPGPRRPAQPRHQRPRQPGPDPAADPQPDADVGPAAARRGRDDVLDLAAPRTGRPHHRARRAVVDEGHRRAGPAEVHRPVAVHRRAQRPDRGDLHRARHREGVRAPAAGRGPVQRAPTSGSTSRRSAPSSCRA